MANYKKQEDLLSIFNDDPFGLLNVAPKSAPVRNEDERLVASFQEIVDFFAINSREPVQQNNNMQETTLYFRLKGLREHPEKREILASRDKYCLLKSEEQEISSLDDILNNDSLGLLNDKSEGLFDFKHIKSEDERASADFVARRKPCRDFEKYEPVFKEVQKDLSMKDRSLIAFKEENLREGDFYVHNGVLLLLEKVEFEEGIQEFKSGSRVRKDGRTRVIFENGTESNMLYRSLYKSLLANGKAVSANINKVNENFIERFSNLTEEDEEAGFIYILKSKSDSPEIKSIPHLYKIGYSTTPVEDRIKNAINEPTYLFADVSIVSVFKCFNMNTQKLELLLHNFFGSSCLNVDVYGKNGQRYTPREWFIAPIKIIEQAIQLMINGKIVSYQYDPIEQQIVMK